MPYTFAVAPVTRGTRFPPRRSISEVSKVFVNYWDGKYTQGSKAPEKPQSLEFEVGQVNHKELIQGEGNLHGFVNTVLSAYNNHFPLILSPDDFWLLISLSVSQFLSQAPGMAEKYRKIFVNHEGQKKLTIDGTNYGIQAKSPKSNKKGWPKCVAEISALVKENTKTNIATILTSPFSTTGPVETTVMQVVLMESVKKYFSYTIYTFCGIPEITLEGTPEDYESITNRTEELIKILPDLKWYFARVLGHLEKITDSVKGNANQEFWRQMVMRPREGSGCIFMNGWISDFFAYTLSEGSHKFHSTESNKWERINLQHLSFPAVTLTEFKFYDMLHTGKEYDMRLAAGFLTVARDDNKTKAVRPAIGWMTYYTNENERPLNEEDYKDAV